jgi:hypothetical protein
MYRRATLPSVAPRTALRQRGLLAPKLGHRNKRTVDIAGAFTLKFKTDLYQSCGIGSKI